MTYCLGIKVASGLVAIADTRLTSGTEVSTNKKVSVYQSKKHSIFVMTSGLRSVRDKAITYFKEVLEERDASFNKLYKAVNALGEQVRRVAEEDRQSLNAAGLSFNLFAIVGGQLENDTEHKLFLLYPEGNWVEVGDGSPFIIIGNSGYGKPLLYRSLRFDSSMQDALKIGFFQCIAMIPGVSRSASTIIGGMLQGLSRKQAAEFSFFLAVPTMAAAGGYKLLKTYDTIQAADIKVLLIGNLVAFVVAMLAIKFFISFLTKYGFKVFGYYRIILGLVLLGLLASGYKLDVV